MATEGWPRRGFLHYDGTLSFLDDPPNQHYSHQSVNFRGFATHAGARFAQMN